MFNASGRAYPDFAAVATPYEVVASGYVQTGTGTSASTPTASAVISFLNQHRVAGGKASLGFLNPLIYGVLGPKGCFRDVTKGCNPGPHEKPGFYATEGFDAATGWGSPNFDALLAEVMKLR